MQSKLYQFDVIRGLVNAVFEVKDPNTGATLLLYEWTPPVAERTAAKERLAKVRGDLNCDVFTADASLYLTAPSSDAGKKALAALRSYNLFTGEWPTQSFVLTQRPSIPRTRAFEPYSPPNLEKDTAGPAKSHQVPSQWKSENIRAQYNTARIRGAKGEDWFIETYRCTTLICLNLNEFVVDPDTILRFEESSRGAFLAVEHEEQTLLVPSFQIDLEAARRALEGVFLYHERMSEVDTAMMVPASVHRRAGKWVLDRPGEIVVNTPPAVAMERYLKSIPGKVPVVEEAPGPAVEEVSMSDVPPVDEFATALWVGLTMMGCLLIAGGYIFFGFRGAMLAVLAFVIVVAVVKANRS